MARRPLPDGSNAMWDKFAARAGQIALGFLVLAAGLAVLAVVG